VFALVVRFDLPDAAAAEAFDALVADVLPGIRSSEPGTLLYLTHTVDGEPLARVFYEAYRDRAGHAEHEARPQTAAFLERVRDLGPQVRLELLTPDDDELPAVSRG
jgi:quinol monooxygenase YgiN